MSQHTKGNRRSLWQRIAWILIALGGAQFGASLFRAQLSSGWGALLTAFLPVTLGTIVHTTATYAGTTPGIKNNDSVRKKVSNRGVLGILFGGALIAFYICLYWYPNVLKGATALMDPLSRLHNGKNASHWYLYGYLYTFAVFLMGIRVYYRYRHNRYQLIRNTSVILVQLVLSFIIPGLLKALNQPDFYFSYFWPLKQDYLFPAYQKYLFNHPSGRGMFFFLWGTMMSFVAVPVLTYFYGKRWYCSWVCGCGALAETLGDPFRQLSNKSVKAWRFERWSIHLVLLIIVGGTVLLWINAVMEGDILGSASKHFNKSYSFVVSAMLAGVVGTGFYPFFGNRVWCRFFCPQAAILGILQRFFSRFRITTNGDQCMSCGNCSSYCEMGIDVRAYAQRGDNIVRASCVGCGICAAVCPRGVLKLENGKTHADRYPGSEKPINALWRSLTWTGK